MVRCRKIFSKRKMAHMWISLENQDSKTPATGTLGLVQGIAADCFLQPTTIQDTSRINFEITPGPRKCGTNKDHKDLFRLFLVALEADTPCARASQEAP